MKDSINDCVIRGRLDLVNPNRIGTKAAAHYRFLVAPQKTVSIRLRLRGTNNPSDSGEASHDPLHDFDETLLRRSTEADAFYADLAPSCLSVEHRAIQRQALAGMLWSKQFYHYVVEEWLDGDPGQPLPPSERLDGRNSEWRHIYNERVMSMPDKWEYPWYASWDLAFHCIPLALVDPHFAKDQLSLIVREWYQHPNGEIPAYEWNFSDVNPPVLAWAAFRIYQIERKQKRPGRSGLSRNDLSQNVDRLHLVGESQRFPGEKHLSREDSSALITSAFSIVTFASPTAAISSRAMAPAGWECSRSISCASRSSSRGKTAFTKISRRNSSSTFSVSPRP